jgi:hypothetical protein
LPLIVRDQSRPVAGSIPASLAQSEKKMGAVPSVHGHGFVPEEIDLKRPPPQQTVPQQHYQDEKVAPRSQPKNQSRTQFNLLNRLRAAKDDVMQQVREVRDAFSGAQQPSYGYGNHHYGYGAPNYGYTPYHGGYQPDHSYQHQRGFGFGSMMSPDHHSPYTPRSMGPMQFVKFLFLGTMPGGRSILDFAFGHDPNFMRNMQYPQANYGMPLAHQPPPGLHGTQYPHQDFKTPHEPYTEHHFEPPRHFDQSYRHHAAYTPPYPAYLTPFNMMEYFAPHRLMAGMNPTAQHNGSFHDQSFHGSQYNGQQFNGPQFNAPPPDPTMIKDKDGNWMTPPPAYRDDRPKEAKVTTSAPGPEQPKSSAPSHRLQARLLDQWSSKT